MDVAINKITKELKRSDQSLNIKTLIESVKAENASLKEKCHSLEMRIDKLEKFRDDHTSLHHKHERFLIRNNIRSVGYPAADDENCLEITKDVIAKIGIPDCRLERAHRDGRLVNGRDRHILIKLLYFQDKILIMKNARQALWLVS